LESVGTDMGEWKGYVHLCENGSIQEVKGTHILGGMVRYKFKRVYTNRKSIPSDYLNCYSKRRV
jgi:hypothetical protein